MLGEHIARDRFGYLEVCAALFRVLSREMGFVGVVLLSSVAGLGLVVAYFEPRDLRKPASALRNAFWERRQGLMLLWAILYTALLVRSEVHVAIDPINARLLAPALVLFVLFAAVLVSNIVRSFGWIISLLALVLLAASFGARQPMATALWHARVVPPYVHDASRIPTFSWIADHATHDDLLIAEDSFKLPLYAGPFNMLYLDSHLPPAHPLQYEDLNVYLAKHRDEYKRAYLILRAGRGAIAPRVAEWGSFPNEIDAGKLESYPGIVKEADLEDGTVFRIDPVQR
jgi:hypothetical protein